MYKELGGRFQLMAWARRVSNLWNEQGFAQTLARSFQDEFPETDSNEC